MRTRCVRLSTDISSLHKLLDAKIEFDDPEAIVDSDQNIDSTTWRSYLYSEHRAVMCPSEMVKQIKILTLILTEYLR